MPPTVNRKPGGLVSRRVEMYEAPFNSARKGYSHRSQDSFHTNSLPTAEESRDDVDDATTVKASAPEPIPTPTPTPNAQDTKVPMVSPTVPKAPTVRKAPTEQKVPTELRAPKLPKVPRDYPGRSFIESGVSYYNEGEYEKALKAFTTALKTQRVSAGDDDICIALTLGNLGSVYLQQNNLDEAERVLQESLDIKKRIAPDIVVADTLNNLGNCANLRGEFEVSLIFYEEALEDIRSKKGRRADEINALFNIGRLEIQRQHWTKAMIALDEACRSARAHYGTNHVFVAQTLDLMGFVQLSTSKMDASMVSFTGALAIYRRLYGPMHVEVANSLFNVGMVREAKGDLADAWEAYTTARDLYSRLGMEHEHAGYTTVRKSIANVERTIAKQNHQRLLSKHKTSGRPSSGKSDIL
jgi:tetratricopeptide (TPR) repeat protein